MNNLNQGKNEGAAEAPGNLLGLRGVILRSITNFKSERDGGSPAAAPLALLTSSESRAKWKGNLTVLRGAIHRSITNLE